jgi:hypothetical protein
MSTWWSNWKKDFRPPYITFPSMGLAKNRCRGFFEHHVKIHYWIKCIFYGKCQELQSMSNPCKFFSSFYLAILPQIEPLHERPQDLYFFNKIKHMPCGNHLLHFSNYIFLLSPSALCDTSFSTLHVACYYMKLISK